MAEQVAWIGLGNMGRGMIKNLVAKYPFQTPLIIYNRTQSRATELAPTLSKPVTVVPTITEAVAPSSIIFICLSDDNAVTETLQTAISTCDIAGKLFVDCSTVHPDTSRSEAKLVELHGGSFVACPVFGTAPVADAGQLVCVLAGKKDLVERVKPFCAGVMGRINLDVSTPPTGAAGNEDVVVDPGRASLLKIMGNSLGLNLVDAVAEAMTVAEKSGLGVDTLHNFLELMYPGMYVGYSNRMRSGDYYQRDEPLFAADLARKDAKHAMDVARSVGVRMRGLELADEYLQGVKKRQGEKGDLAAIYGVVREEGGLKFEN
ncbi:6-phosphogluconate dehydrogenase [Histoplasma capsulatum var. duboisii H88]|uniref:6-phosphogluconate dehydrogenase n=1 Tax=Ajellomyces capsulatus (strain H88) TaxID=544711 RepID=F0U6T4_AJEC8|nr:6-phosphogluconate dehydrogenase [Histoplasma capsulatum var. duboisii H88]QSS52059.1 6-phosphogluconate dehydrogenase [Histoplasma capsulatum var. duboisii H88]